MHDVLASLASLRGEAIATSEGWMAPPRPTRWLERSRAGRETLQDDPVTTRAFASAFRGSLTRLGSPPADQMRYLTALGTADLLDELALEFDCYFVPLAGELRRRAPRWESLCRRLDGMLGSDTLGWRFDDGGGT